MKVNIGKMFANRAFLTPDLEACIGNGYRYDYKKMNQRINRFAACLSASDITRGDRIAILAKNNEQVITALFASAKIGAITVVLNFRLQAPELSYILSDSQAKFMVYGAEFVGVVESLKNEIPVQRFVSIGKAGADTEFESAIQGMDDSEPAITGGGEEPAVLMYTSGTTGKPKGVTLTHNNLFWAATGLVHTLDWAYKYRYLSVAPLFHIGGLAPIFANVHVGCTMVFMPDFDPGKAWQIILDEKINFAMTVPVMLQYMQMIPGIDQMDLSCLRHFICGGSAVPRALIASYRDMGIDIHQVYGATEYSGAISFWSPDMGFEKSTSMGKPVFHGDIKIIAPETGRETEPEEVGEICILGPQVFKGYWKNQAASDEVLINGYYRSGDLGKKDADGFVYVVDRLKDMIISGSENIYPAELESVIASHPGIADVAVVGKPHEKWGEIPVAFVVKKPGAKIIEQDIIQLCRENLAGFKCIKELCFIDEIPRNTLGKILKRSLRDQVA
ncbi:MAG: long-chain fatty acid--CoA ligase [Deltaproteobacteria bacterium]|nr:long-chain fatty acid--CoA ligase [Deltaproteobacteria bacterium]